MKKLLFLFAMLISFSAFSQTATTTIDAVITDPDGMISAIKWEKVSGPNMKFSATDRASITVSELTAGDYVFQLTATDNLGASATETFELKVLPKNRPPLIIISGGNKKTIQIK